MLMHWQQMKRLLVMKDRGAGGNKRPPEQGCGALVLSYCAFSKPLAFVEKTITGSSLSKIYGSISHAMLQTVCDSKEIYKHANSNYR